MSAITTSIFDIFKIGPGPSSSHTIGPMRASFRFRNSIGKLPKDSLKTATGVEVHLFGSLSATGRGHGTDRAVVAGLLGWQPETCDPEEVLKLLKNDKDLYSIDVGDVSIPVSAKSIIFDRGEHSFPFNNTMVMRLMTGGRAILEKEYYSVGGGFIEEKDGAEEDRPDPPYRYCNMNEMKVVLASEGIGLAELVLKNEEVLTGRGEIQVVDELKRVISTMMDSVERGLATEGLLPGPIRLARKAPTLHKTAQTLPTGDVAGHFLVYLDAYALAASEENAAGHRVVTAPTSGSAGVIPGILYLLKQHFNVSEERLCRGMFAAAVIGFIVKHNASIAGAEVGCQGEIGVASSMAAALLAYINNYQIEVVENAAEIALEHHLGMTCDPVGGYVQIPCIERNAVGAVDAYNAYLLASAGDPKKQKLKFDQVVEAMLETGRDMSKKYKETAEGGLAVCAAIC